MMRWTTTLAALFAMTLFLAPVGCTQQGGDEGTGNGANGASNTMQEEGENAADQMGDAAQNAADAIGDAAQDAADAVGDAAQNAADQAQDAMQGGNGGGN